MVVVDFGFDRAVRAGEASASAPLPDETATVGAVEVGDELCDRRAASADRAGAFARAAANASSPELAPKIANSVTTTAVIGAANIERCCQESFPRVRVATAFPLMHTVASVRRDRGAGGRSPLDRPSPSTS